MRVQKIGRTELRGTLWENSSVRLNPNPEFLTVLQASVDAVLNVSLATESCLSGGGQRFRV
jgi:hypothetical protein